MKSRVTVALSRCPAYTTDLRTAVEELLAHLGGIEAFVQPGQTVLVKPNLLTARTPDQAVTTHPEVVRALLRILKKRGARPSVGDSPANVMKMEQVWEQTGFRKLCQEENVPLINLDRAGSQTFQLAGTTVSIARPVLDADVVISVPKIKTHVLTVFTGAVKNLYGTIPGFQKAALHKQFPKPGPFGHLLADVYEAVRPALALADGIVGMDGDGPSGGRPAPLGLLAASADSVALDAEVCRLVGIDPLRVAYLKELQRRKAGCVAAEEIEPLGAPASELKPDRFRVPSTLATHFIPGWLVALLHPLIWIRPAFNSACISCGRCVKACPTEALSLEPKRRPSLRADRCIGCCCCHEVCPAQAVQMTQSPLLSFVRRGRM